MRKNKTNQTLILMGAAAVTGVLATGTAERVRAASPAVGASSSPSTSGTLTEEQKIVHVLNRLGYGASPGDVARVRTMGLDRYIDAQLHPEGIDDGAVDGKLAGFASLSLSGDDLARLWAERLGALKEARTLRQAILKTDPNSKTTGADVMTPTAVGVIPPTAAMPEGAAPGAATPNANALVMADATPEQQAEILKLRQTVQMRQQAVVRATTQLVTAKTLRAVESKRQLQEVLVDFWGNHFNIDMRKGACSTLKVADDRDTIRPHVLGKFRDLLGASAKSAAMLFYLDNFQSTSPHAPPQRPGGGFGRRRVAGLGEIPPAQVGKARRGGLNENYGREIMELHTLGVDGGYTQKDVTEVARCFTGWSLNRVAPEVPDPMYPKQLRPGGTFHFYPLLHDEGEKTVLGHRIAAGGGIGDGEQVLDILASAPATMRHISSELCQRLVADVPPPALVDKCVATWKRTDGDLREIVRTIVTSPEFYSKAAYATKIKSPFEFAVSSVRALGGTYDLSPATRQAVQAVRNKGRYANFGTNTLAGQVSTMGEPIFQYQAPTGYPEDSRKWVSAGALISRLNFSLALTNRSLLEIGIPDTDQKTMGLTGAAQIVDLLNRDILYGGMSASTRATLLRQAATADTPNVSAAADLNLTRRLMAFVLGSPEFQRR